MHTGPFLFMFKVHWVKQLPPIVFTSFSDPLGAAIGSVAKITLFMWLHTFLCNKVIAFQAPFEDVKTVQREW